MTMRYFNTAGPCKPDMHYMLPVLSRLPGVRSGFVFANPIYREVVSFVSPT